MRQPRPLLGTLLAAALAAAALTGLGAPPTAAAPAHARQTPAVYQPGLGGYGPLLGGYANPHSVPDALGGPVHQVCPRPTSPHVMACQALLRVDIGQQILGPADAPKGYGPADLRAAYNLPGGDAGSGATVAVIDALDWPTAEADVAAYRVTYGLPPCTSASGCFRKVDENGGANLPDPAPAGNDWTVEEALDVDMVSAVCPNCKILLVEAASASTADLGTSVDTAASLGAKYISNSYGSWQEDITADHYYTHPGVAVTASSGDGGFGVNYPASSASVIAVGGTTLAKGGGGRGWSESAWSGAGSGCSGPELKPAWQKDPDCPRRALTDVSAVADPKTGVAAYDTFNNNKGWIVVGGTSAAAPIIAAVYALAGVPGSADNPAAYPYAHPAALNDVTTGSNGHCVPLNYYCQAGPGYDGPTGLGTPNGVTAFRAGG